MPYKYAIYIPLFVFSFLSVAGAQGFVGLVSVLAGTGMPGWQDGPLLNATFQGPFGISTHPSTQSFLLADEMNQVVRKITLNFDGSGLVETVVGLPWEVDTDHPHVTGKGTLARLAYPETIAIHPSGQYFIVGCKGSVYRNISLPDYYAAFGDTALLYPWVAFDTDGAVYLSDRASHRIVLFIPSEEPQEFVGSWAGVSGFRDGFGTEARFNQPGGIQFDSISRTIYVADSENHAIRKIDIETAQVTTIAGRGVPGFADGEGTSSLLNRPLDVALDESARRLYVADSGNRLIRALDVNTAYLYTLAGHPQFEGSDDGVGLDVRFRFPVSVAWHGALGLLVISDQRDNRLRKLELQPGTYPVDGLEITPLPTAAPTDSRVPTNAGTTAPSPSPSAFFAPTPSVTPSPSPSPSQTPTPSPTPWKAAAGAMFVSLDPSVAQNPDVFVPLPVSQLVLQLSNADGFEVSFWDETSGAPLDILAIDSSHAFANNVSLAGVYVFKAFVRYPDGSLGSTSVRVFANTSLVVDLGRDILVDLPVDAVDIKANFSGFNDPAVDFRWIQLTDCGNLILVGTKTDTLHLQHPPVGKYVFQAIAMQPNGSSAVDTVTVIVRPDPRGWLVAVIAKIAAGCVIALGLLASVLAASVSDRFKGVLQPSLTTVEHLQTIVSFLALQIPLHPLIYQFASPLAFLLLYTGVSSDFDMAAYVEACGMPWAPLIGQHSVVIYAALFLTVLSIVHFITYKVYRRFGNVSRTATNDRRLVFWRYQLLTDEQTADPVVVQRPRNLPAPFAFPSLEVMLFVAAFSGFAMSTCRDLGVILEEYSVFQPEQQAPITLKVDDGMSEIYVLRDTAFGERSQIPLTAWGKLLIVFLNLIMFLLPWILGFLLWSTFSQLLAARRTASNALLSPEEVFRSLTPTPDDDSKQKGGSSSKWYSQSLADLLAPFRETRTCYLFPAFETEVKYLRAVLLGIVIHRGSLRGGLIQAFGTVVLLAFRAIVILFTRPYRNPWMNSVTFLCGVNEALALGLCIHAALTKTPEPYLDEALTFLLVSNIVLLIVYGISYFGIVLRIGEAVLAGSNWVRRRFGATLEDIKALDIADRGAIAYLLGFLFYLPRMAFDIAIHMCIKCCRSQKKQKRLLALEMDESSFRRSMFFSSSHRGFNIFVRDRPTFPLHDVKAYALDGPQDFVKSEAPQEPNFFRYRILLPGVPSSTEPTVSFARRFSNCPGVLKRGWTTGARVTVDNGYSDVQLFFMFDADRFSSRQSQDEVIASDKARVKLDKLVHSYAANLIDISVSAHREKSIRLPSYGEQKYFRSIGGNLLGTPDVWRGLPCELACLDFDLPVGPAQYASTRISASLDRALRSGKNSCPNFLHVFDYFMLDSKPPRLNPLSRQPCKTVCSVTETTDMTLQSFVSLTTFSDVPALLEEMLQGIVAQVVLAIHSAQTAEFLGVRLDFRHNRLLPSSIMLKFCPPVRDIVTSRRLASSASRLPPVAADAHPIHVNRRDAIWTKRYLMYEVAPRAGTASRRASTWLDLYRVPLIKIIDMSAASCRVLSADGRPTAVPVRGHAHPYIADAAGSTAASASNDSTDPATDLRVFGSSFLQLLMSCERTFGRVPPALRDLLQTLASLPASRSRPSSSTGQSQAATKSGHFGTTIPTSPSAPYFASLLEHPFLKALAKPPSNRPSPVVGNSIFFSDHAENTVLYPSPL